MPFRRSVVALAFAVSCTWSAHAAANGRFPTAQHVLVGPGAGSDTIVLRATFGLVISDDGGKTFHYVCEEAMGYGGSAFDPAVGLDASGRMLVGLYDGAVRVGTDRCDAPRVPTLAGEYVSDVDTNATGDVMAVSTATGFTEQRNYVWRSEDSGATFTRLGTGQLGTQFETLELAPTNDRRVYATALQLAPRRVVVYRSDDGGATLVDLTSFPQPDAIGAYVAAVDPTNADTVYVRTIVAKVPGPGRQTALLRSDDAGATWTEVVRTADLMTGFAIAGDGEKLWIGGLDPADGLQRSLDRGATWTRIADTKVQCLRWHAGSLYVCATNETDHYALGRSCDDGTTIHPLLGFSSIAGVFACPSTSLETTSCPTRLDAIRPQFPTGDLPADDCATSSDAGADTSPLLDADRDADVSPADSSDAADSTPDADAPGPEDASLVDAASEGQEVAGSGCQCALHAVTRPADPRWLALTVVAFGAVFLRRRARHRRP